MRSIAAGTTADGDWWDLQAGPGGARPGGGNYGPALMLYIETIAGHHVGGGAADMELNGSHMVVATTVGDHGPRGWIVLAGEHVHSVWATLSSGAREPVVLYAAPELGRLRAGALLFERSLDVHRLDAFNAAGGQLADLLPG